MKIKRISITIAIFLFAAILCGQTFAATVTYTYDNLNRLTKVDYGNGTTISYTYDAAGNRLTMAGITDTDGDGIPDSQDALPNDPNEWEDTDGDGTGNNADTDDDNDGMPDGWEVTYGLDPLVNDSNGDLDGDGITNLQEYFNGTNPNQPDPYPNIKANGSEGLFTLGTSDTLSVKVGLDAGSSLGEGCDWWVVVLTPSGEWKHYDLSQGTFSPGLSVTYQGPLVDLGSTEIFNTSGLSAGTYTYYFGFDLNMNGALDTGTGLLYYDSVEVKVTDTPLPKIYANGSGESLTISTLKQLEIGISISSSNYFDTNADWWIVVNTPSGEWQHYDLDSRTFIHGLDVTYQGALFNLDSTEIFNTSGLSAGTYTYYFGIDLNMNGILDTGEGQLYYDSVVVNITP